MSSVGPPGGRRLRGRRRAEPARRHPAGRASTSSSTASAATPGATPGPGSPPPPRSTGATSASTSPCRWRPAAWWSATRSSSPSRSSWSSPAVVAAAGTRSTTEADRPTSRSASVASGYRYWPGAGAGSAVATRVTSPRRSNSSARVRPSAPGVPSAQEGGALGRRQGGELDLGQAPAGTDHRRVEAAEGLVGGDEHQDPHALAEEAVGHVEQAGQGLAGRPAWRRPAAARRRPPAPAAATGRAVGPVRRRRRRPRRWTPAAPTAGTRRCPGTARGRPRRASSTSRTSSGPGPGWRWSCPCPAARATAGGGPRRPAASSPSGRRAGGARRPCSGTRSTPTWGRRAGGAPSAGCTGPGTRTRPGPPPAGARPPAPATARRPPSSPAARGRPPPPAPWRQPDVHRSTSTVHPSPPASIRCHFSPVTWRRTEPTGTRSAARATPSRSKHAT